MNTVIKPSASTVMTVAQIAREERVHPSTVRRWICAGCPTVRLGEAGRGKGALLDLQAVRAWRVAQLVPGLAKAAKADLLAIVETALIDALKRDNLAHCARVTDAQAQMMILLIYERAFLNVNQEPLTRERVPEQMKRMCAVCLQSVKNGTFQRR